MSLTRHPHSTSKKPLTLASDHPAIIEGRSLFRVSANESKRHKARVLVSGLNSRKIGNAVTKGALKGFPIHTLTLAERATCPRDCSMWSSCYSNRMPWAIRWPSGADTEAKIEAELADLQERHPSGLLVRLHVLGDFYSSEYVGRWEGWLTQFPALHVFGFTARHDDEIAAAIQRLAERDWTRWAIRSSDAKQVGLPASKVIGDGDAPDGIMCPAQLHKTAACGSCSLCWSAPDKTILFTAH